MKANELRFGNLVDYYGNVGTINSIDDMEVGFSDYETSDYPYLEEIKPIPLTEEWLIRFGFENGYDDYWSLPNHCVVELLNQGTEFTVFDSSGCKIAFLKYVHQLQNLYFALTGEELTLQQ